MSRVHTQGSHQRLGAEAEWDAFQRKACQVLPHVVAVPHCPLEAAVRVPRGPSHLRIRSSVATPKAIRGSDPI
eukprot:8005848-Pyramimonas_sp.AAC.1